MMIEFEYPQGATPVDADEAEGLLLTHITTREELNRWEQDNILAAKDWIKRSGPSDVLSEEFIKTLHKQMFGKVWKWAGQFRKSNKNLGCEWYQIPMTLRSLCEDTRLWINEDDDSPDMIAVRFHHRLVSIHPFPNGNGRHAREVANLLLTNMLDHHPLTWGGDSLSTANDARDRYIKALQAADQGDYDPLLAFVRT